MLNIRASARVAVALAAFCLALAPVAGEDEYVDLIEAESEIPEDHLLDVGIRIFDPGLPEDDADALEKKGIFEDVRESEARFIPFHLKATLESSGQWGAVRVLPTGAESVDVMISGTIRESTGMKLVLDITVVDAAGRVWRDKRYKAEADSDAYDEEEFEPRDPYQDMYNRIANDMIEARRKLDGDDLRDVREIARLRFAVGLAPDIYGDYVHSGRNGKLQLQRLPAEDDPIMERIARIRERDYMFVDTLNEYYADFYERMNGPYADWRTYSYHEQRDLMAIRRQARTRKILGGLLIVFGVAQGGDVGDVAAVGGAMTVAKGFEKGQEAKIHREALRELAESFDSEMAPLLVEVEGETLRLEGSAETQFSQWREIIRRMFAAETGLPLDTNEDAGTASPDEPDR